LVIYVDAPPGDQRADAEIAVLNLILRNVPQSWKGRLVHHFAREADGASHDNMTPLLQRNPDNIYKLTEAIALPLQLTCKETDISAEAVVLQELDKKEIKIQVVGCEVSDDPFVFIYNPQCGSLDNVTPFLRRISKLGYLRQTPTANLPLDAQAEDGHEQRASMVSVDLQIPPWTGTLHSK